MQKLGLTDISIQTINDDKFSLQPYVKSLKDFITTCDTPMTIAVQGDWGCGKTSFMQLIRESLKETNYQTFWFNTWQFSQFNMSDTLPITFLTQLCNVISPEDTSFSSKVKPLLKTVLKYSASGLASHFVGETVSEALLSSNDNIDAIDTIVTLKTTFEEQVKLLSENNSRLVIFIDDLDRLQPIRAIELLENHVLQYREHLFLYGNKVSMKYMYMEDLFLQELYL